MQEVDHLVVPTSPQDFVPLKPLSNGGEKDTSFRTHSLTLPSERGSGGLTADNGMFSKTVEDIVDRHFEQLDQRLENMFTKEEQR